MAIVNAGIDVGLSLYPGRKRRRQDARLSRIFRRMLMDFIYFVISYVTFTVHSVLVWGCRGRTKGRRRNKEMTSKIMPKQ